ncbi:RNA polymerase sigma factor [Membranihabitans marinus]|uniref:RNA polymerase sigma factor n=1 Tax=Membranihabitans marinus TaxID=1227546 RepID=UPI001F1FDC8B|nr:sigma-70 family RNA polymerase sigma factor [Membranihabitans marinus]
MQNKMKRSVYSHFDFTDLYDENFSKISKFVQDNNGNTADAEDLFQDTMMVLVEKLKNDDFVLTASVNTYVFAISKNLWTKKLQDEEYHLTLDELNGSDFQDQIDAAIINELSLMEKLKRYLNKITDHCHRLINDMFFKGKTIERIQSEYGYTTRHNAHNQKYKCIQQIRKVKESEELLND